MLTFFNAVQRRKPNQAARAANSIHHLITSINAGGAVDAFHLSAVPDIDAGWADTDAFEAINAIA
ncbi:MAG TPA: hypothetical protein VFL42_10190, partial [Terriglobales bacterium]|nr:hypothetical protein [Terriglobales bacterium]